MEVSGFHRWAKQPLQRHTKKEKSRTKRPTILGLNACQNLKIVAINNELKTAPSMIDRDVSIKNWPRIRNKDELMRMYPERFDDTVGCYEKCWYYTTFGPNAKSIDQPPHHVPLEFRDKLKAELDRMEKINNHQRDWTSRGVEFNCN